MLSNKLTMAVAGAAAGEPYWISTYGGTGADFGQGIAVDSSGNIIFFGWRTSLGCLITKYDTSGTIQWQRRLGSNSAEGLGIALDSSGNFYVTGSDSGLFVAKYNTSGTIQWQRKLGASPTKGLGIALDSSGNVYVIGQIGTQAGDLLIAKYDTNGTIQWQRMLGGADGDYGYGIAVDSSGNVYVTGTTRSHVAENSYLLIAKYNTSGTIQWQRTLGDAAWDNGNGIAVDSSGNVYVTGYTVSQGAGSTDLLVAKYDTSGTIQWQRVLGGASSEYGYGIAVDSSGNVYVTGYTQSQGAGSQDFLIAKYDTSGTIQWQRALGGASADNGFGIAVDAASNIYVTGWTISTGVGGQDTLVAKLPPDGLGTGTYGVFTYQASTLTDAASTLTDAASTLTDATSTLTAATSTMTDAALIQTFTMA